MIVCGIDPGTTTTGYGVISVEQNSNLCSLEWGGISPPKGMILNDRIKFIYDRLTELFNKYNPDVVAVEEIFFAKNSQSTIKLGHVRGAILVCAANLCIKISEYTALQIKQSVVGYGRADKVQVRDMVIRLLNLDKPPKPYDASDALAVAICHSNSQTFENRILK